MTQIHVPNPADLTEKPVAPPRKPRRVNTDTAIGWSTVFILIAVVALADFLFWGYTAGISLVVFSAALTVAALVNLRPDLSHKDWAIFGGLWVVLAAPSVEYLQETAVLFLMFGHIGLLIWAALKTDKWGTILRNIVSLVVLIPICSVISSIATWHAVKTKGRIDMKVEMLLMTALPILFGGLFFVLFVGANPIFEGWVNAIWTVNPDFGDPGRIMFWGFIGFLTLPFVMFATLAKLFTQPHVKYGPTRPIFPGIVTAPSIILSLAMFNAMFALQNVTDLAFLWGGAALPEGMTYATYVHRGAYPLMATSVLAGIFVLISRRFTQSSPILKMLLLVWIAQNILLVGSALARLDLYIEAYGLTYLRVRAGIGMGLVIVGMGLLAWQILARVPNGKVSAVFSSLVLCVFYVGSFVNFANVITAENLSRDAARIDEYYLCKMVPLNVVALTDHLKAEDKAYCAYRVKHMKNRPEGWRDWSWRKARINAHLSDYRILTWGRPVTRPLTTLPLSGGSSTMERSLR